MGETINWEGETMARELRCETRVYTRDGSPGWYDIRVLRDFGGAPVRVERWYAGHVLVCRREIANDEASQPPLFNPPDTQWLAQDMRDAGTWQFSDIYRRYVLPRAVRAWLAGAESPWLLQIMEAAAGEWMTPRVDGRIHVSGVSAHPMRVAVLDLEATAARLIALCEQLDALVVEPATAT